MKHFLLITGLLLVVMNVVVVKADQSIRVASIFAKTGKAARFNLQALHGVRFAVEELNLNGGLMGRQLELIELDNRSTALGSKKAAMQAVERGVVTVFGASFSSHSLAMAPVLQSARIPMISPFSTNPQLTKTGDYIFRVCYTDPFQGRILANFAIHDLKVKTAGVLSNASSVYSEDLGKYFMKEFMRQGGEIVMYDSFLEKTADYLPLLQMVQQKKPDLVFLPEHANVAGYIIKQARQIGIQTRFLGGDGWNESMYGLVGDVIEGNFYSNHWHPGSSNERSRQFVKRYEKASRDYGPGNALGEDCVNLFADAVRRASSFETAEIRDALAATRDFQGVTGTISFDENRDPVKPLVILKFINGTSVYVKTVEP